MHSSLSVDHCHDRGTRVSARFTCVAISVVTCDDPCLQVMGQAAVDGDIKTLRLLIENGVDVDIMDYDQRTPL